MEHFPSSYEKQWAFIKPLIEKSDYFICLIAGKYGHCGADNISFTQREFLYALEKDVPILVFYHKCPQDLPADKREDAPDKKAALDLFRELAKRDRLCEAWTTNEQLASLVIQSIIQVAYDFPRPGWRYRGEPSTEHLELQLKVSTLEQQLSEAHIKGRSAPVTSFRNYEQAAPTIAATLETTAALCLESEEVLKIRMMGVCLHMSFPTLTRFIESAPESLRIQVRLAILDKQSPVSALLNSRWRTVYPVFDDDLADLVDRLKSGKLRKNVSLKLVHYNHMPNWHGVLINYDHLFMGHCLWQEDGRLTVGQNPYDYYRSGESALHDRKIKQYVHWFDYCRNTATQKDHIYELVDTGPRYISPSPI